MERHSKKLQKLSKSIKKSLFFGIFSEFVQFWLENSGSNHLDELKWIILPRGGIIVEISWLLHFFFLTCGAT
jgi:hypothetical protein